MSPTSSAATVWIYDVGTDNHTPVALTDTYSCQPNSVLSIGPSGVLAHDGDPDEDQLSVIGEQLPVHGTLTLRNNGSFVYTPTTGWFGEDTFVMTRVGVPSTSVSTASTTASLPSASGSGRN
jgi:hypothetical protein